MAARYQVVAHVPVVDCASTDLSEGGLNLEVGFAGLDGQATGIDQIDELLRPARWSGKA